MKKPAVFLDRDGTIIEDRGHLSDPAEVRFLPGTADSLKKLLPRFELFIVTHQPGIARELITSDQSATVNVYVVDVLGSAGVVIRETYTCPHDRSDGCQCIKPLPFFLREAAQKHAIDLVHSFVVGDHPHDVELAVNADATGIYVLTGHGEKHRDAVPDGTVVVPGIGEAVNYILSK